MKKIYLTLFIAFLGGQLMAQSSTTTNGQSTIKQTVTSSATSTSNGEVDVVVAGLPGFPVYLNTGDQMVDDANYAVAKQNWINENQDIYSIYSRTGVLKTTSISLTGYPVYNNTGNPTEDYTNYKSARDSWMIDNGTLYVKYINSIRK